MGVVIKIFEYVSVAKLKELTDTHTDNRTLLPTLCGEGNKIAERMYTNPYVHRLLKVKVNSITDAEIELQTL